MGFLLDVVDRRVLHRAGLPVKTKNTSAAHFEDVLMAATHIGPRSERVEPIRQMARCKPVLTNTPENRVHGSSLQVDAWGRNAQARMPGSALGPRSISFERWQMRSGWQSARTRQRPCR